MTPLLRLRLAKWLVDLGLDIMSFGPRDPLDDKYYRVLILKWRKLNRLEKRLLNGTVTRSAGPDRARNLDPN